MLRLRWLRNVRLGIKNLLLHKLRSMLTMLGVLFGVASVIAMLAVGEGASKEALEQIAKLGSRNILITSLKPSEDESSGNTTTRMSVYGLRYDDASRVSQTFGAVHRTVPVKVVRKEGRLRSRKLEMRLVGTTPAWFELVDRPMIAGRSLQQRDMAARSNAAVLTEFGARRLLATERSIGESVRIGGDYFEVVGIVQSEDTEAGGIQTPDRQVDAYIAIDVARERFGDVVVRRTAGSRVRERVELNQLIVQVNRNADVAPVANGIAAMLDRFHKKQDYRIDVPLALLRQAEATRRRFNIVLGSIAGISLLVGGIGIMNIMLASVTERTREIGIRRAIGARRGQIVGQFLIETVVLSTLGGLVGIAVGVAIPRLISHFAGMPTVVPLYGVGLALGISMAVGIVFGLYPAMRAARLDPIEALRHE